MVNVPAYGRRPVGEGDDSALEVCPGVSLAHTFDRRDPELKRELMRAWGPVYGVWEGFAADPEIRRRGSSGGAATALALFGIEGAGMRGVLHTAAREDAVYLNRTVLSRTRAELLAGSGSRYAPASPCEGLGEIEGAGGPCVFIGKPCDVAAAEKARKLRPGLDRNLGLTIAFFCAGTPSTEGTLALLKKVGVEDPATITELRYRGHGWPGRWTVRWWAVTEGTEGEQEEREASLSYEESWGFLQKYRQWRCYICPDHSGEFADIAVGDPWYRAVEPGEAGKSLIVARTRRGKEFLERAAAAGAVVLEREDAGLLPASQPNLLRSRGRLWGQLVALRVAGAAVPRYVGFTTFRYWWRVLSLRQKGESTVGTLRRVPRRGLRRRLPVISSTIEPPMHSRRACEA